jgi:hypothetical protein
LAEALPQRIDFGQGKSRMTRHTPAMIASAVLTGLLDHRDVEVAFLRIADDLRLIERYEPGTA